jgi:sortase A
MIPPPKDPRPATSPRTGFLGHDRALPRPPRSFSLAPKTHRRANNWYDVPIVSQRPFEFWTRTDEDERGSVYLKSRSRRRLSRRALALAGVALILLSFVWVFADVQSVGRGTAVAAPKSERLRLTIPKMKRVRDIPVYTGAAGDKGKLAAGALHMEDTGFPWNREANVYIAGHRLGYPGTKSWLVFWNLDRLSDGDRVVLKDAQGKRYVYEVFNKRVVGPNDLSVKEPLEGKNIVTLQTCTLPDYKERLIVRAVLVSG